jgi:hypothetical protein
MTYFPDYLVDARTDLLLYEFGDAEKPGTIENWLVLNPLAQPSLHLQFTGDITPLPLDTRFVVTLETTEGLLLADTTNLIHLID